MLNALTEDGDREEYGSLVMIDEESLLYVSPSIVALREGRDDDSGGGEEEEGQSVIISRELTLRRLGDSVSLDNEGGRGAEKGNAEVRQGLGEDLRD